MWTGGEGVPRHPGGRIPPEDSIQRGLIDLGDGRGADVRRLNQPETPGLAAILGLVEPKPELDWSAEQKARGALVEIRTLLEAMRYENGRRAAMAAYGWPEAGYTGLSTRTQRWKAAISREEGISGDSAHPPERRHVQRRLDCCGGFFRNAAAKLAHDVERRFIALNETERGWETHRPGDPTALPSPPIPVEAERVDVLFCLRGRVGTDHFVYREIRALQPLDGIDAVGWYYNDPDAQLDIEPLLNCTREGILRDLARGGRVATLKFVRSLAVDERYCYAYVVRYNSERHVGRRSLMKSESAARGC